MEVVIADIAGAAELHPQPSSWNARIKKLVFLLFIIPFIVILLVAVIVCCVIAYRASPCQPLTGRVCHPWQKKSTSGEVAMISLALPAAIILTLVVTFIDAPILVIHLAMFVLKDTVVHFVDLIKLLLVISFHVFLLYKASIPIHYFIWNQ